MDRLMKKRLTIVVAMGIVLLVVILALPAFAQTYVATSLPGQPLSGIAAEQIISNSGLPIEELPGGITNSLTRGRDAVNAYRYAHEMLYKNGWYRGISEDHTPLLIAMVDTLKKEGYTSTWLSFEPKKEEILQKFWYASDTENALELGFSSLEDLNSFIDSAIESGKTDQIDALRISLDSKWK